MEDDNRTFKGKTIEQYEEEMEQYRQQYANWKHWCHGKDLGFFPVFSEDFKPHLKTLSGNALRLYIYLGTFVGNYTGETNVSLRSMEQFFDCQIRTIQNWIEELVKAGLIVRIQKTFKNSTFTYMIPYSKQFMQQMEQEREQATS